MSLEPNMVVDLQHKLNKLNDESRQLIQEIEHLDLQSGTCDIRLQRLKKRNLMIKEQIHKIEDLLLPNIIA
jgi:hypothetical protein